MDQLSFDFTKPLEAFEAQKVSRAQRAYLAAKGLTAKNKREAMYAIDRSIYFATDSQRALLLDLGFVAHPQMTKGDAGIKISELLEKKKQKGVSFYHTSFAPLSFT